MKDILTATTTLIPFLDMTDEQFFTLSTRIEGSDGYLTFYVHPFSEKVHPRTPREGYELLREQSLEINYRDNLPVLIAESYQNSRTDNAGKIKLIEWLPYVDNVYVVETFSQSSKLFGPSEAEELFYRRLRSIGVRKLLLAGQYLWYEKNVDVSGELIPSGCVGVFGNKLKKAGFTVEFSNATSPSYLGNFETWDGKKLSA